MTETEGRERCKAVRYSVECLYELEQALVVVKVGSGGRGGWAEVVVGLSVHQQSQRVARLVVITVYYYLLLSSYSSCSSCSSSSSYWAINERLCNRLQHCDTTRRALFMRPGGLTGCHTSQGEKDYMAIYSTSKS